MNSAGAAGVAFGLVLLSAGSAWPQASPFVPAASDLDHDVGAYQLSPRLVLRITHDGDHFHAQLTHQPPFEIIPDGRGGFTSSAQIDASFTFSSDAKDGVKTVVLHQHGRDIPARKIDETLAKAIEAGPGPRTWPMLAISQPRLLTHDGMNYWPCFSPDGKTVLFARNTDGKRWSLYRVPSSGGEMRAFAKDDLTVSATRPSWSAVADAVAFTGTVQGRDAIWVVGGDGTGAHALTVTGVSAEVDYPSWYPDGQRLAAMDAHDLVIRRVDVRGGAAETLTDHAKVLTGMPSVSPDGRWIVFAGQKNSGRAYDQSQNGLWLVAPDGSSKPLESSPGHGRAPVWSPDGKKVAFESDRGSPDGRYAVFIIGRDGSGLVQVTDYTLNATHPVWSPDGRHMVFAVQDGATSQIATIDLP